MNVDWLRQVCLSFPRVTEKIQWGSVLLFNIGGKMFAAAQLEPSRVWLSFKVLPENFVELTERPNIIPAPYLARAKWVALETKDALRPEDLAVLLRESYDLVLARLPKRTREVLFSPKLPARKSQRKRLQKKKRSRSR